MPSRGMSTRPSNPNWTGKPAVSRFEAHSITPLDPEPWLYPDGCREDAPRHVGDESGEEHAAVLFSPRRNTCHNPEHYGLPKDTEVLVADEEWAA